MTESALAERLARLERAARRDRILALGALALMLATAQAPASTPLVVRDAGGGSATLAASGLTFRDARVARAAFGIDKDRHPSLDLSDSAGAIRESMHLLADRPVLRQFDKAGKRRAELFLASDTQNGEFVIRDANDVTRAAAFIGSHGLPELTLYGSDAKVRTYLSADDTAPYLVMKDGAGHSRVVIGAYESGHLGMDLRNAAGTPLWSKP